MNNRADIRRRWIGAIFLGGALLMLVLGETALRDRLDEITFIVFWLICFLLTCGAIFVALLDLSVVRRRTREEHKALFQDALREIESSRDKKKQNTPKL